MKKFLFPLLIIFLPFTAFAKINVVTTTSDLAAIVEEIGGDKITVKSLARGTEDPHFLEPKPSYIVAVSQADLLVEVGLQLEIGWLPVLITQSRNAKIQAGSPGRLDASEKIHLLEVPTGSVNRSQGDVHPDGNPHYWLDPRNGLIIAQEIAEHLSILDAINKEYYQSQLHSFQNKLKLKITDWQKSAASLREQKIVAYHKTYSYLVQWLGLNVMEYLEPKPGVPPSPSHILSLIDLMNKEKIPVVLTSTFYDMKAANELSKKTGAKVITIPTSVGGDKEASSYENLFESILQKLKGNL